MPAATDRKTIVAALEEVWSAMADLGAELPSADWDRESACPGWTVRDLYSHVVGTELMLLGRSDPDGDIGDLAHVHNDIGRMNEQSVARRRDRSGAEVLAEFVSVTHERLDALRAMSEADFDAESFTPAGPDTYGRFMQIRVFDCWIHEQDVRAAVGRPGHTSGTAVDVTLDEHATALGFVVGKKAGFERGQSVRLHLTGGVDRTIDVRVDDRAAVVDDLVEPSVTVTAPVTDWIAVVAGRRSAGVDDPGLTIEGDRALAARLLAHAAYTI